MWNQLFSGTMFSIRFSVKDPIVISEERGLINLEGTHCAVMIDEKLHLATGIDSLDDQELDECDVRIGGLFCEVI